MSRYLMRKRRQVLPARPQDLRESRAARQFRQRYERQLIDARRLGA